MSDHLPEDVAAGTAAGDHQGLGGLDLGGLLASAQEMMANLQSASAASVTGTAGGGAVSVVVNGNFEFSSVSISSDAFDPDDPSLLEDLVLSALRDAAHQLRAGQAGALGGLGLPGGLLAANESEQQDAE